MVLGMRGRKPWGVRLTAGVAVLSMLVGSLRMAYAAPNPSAPTATPGRLYTDVPWAIGTRLYPARMTILAGANGTTNETSLARLFDEQAGTGIESGGKTVRFRLDLAQPSYLDAVAVFGGADGALSIEGDGPKGPSSVLEQASLARGTWRWNRQEIAARPLVSSLVVTWAPAHAGVLLRELELWGRPASAPPSSAAAPLDSLYTGLPPAAHEMRAPQEEQTIALSTVAGPGVGGTFTVPVDLDPQSLDRAFLVYELGGLPHFTAAVRTINGQRALGRFGISRGAKGGLQVEEISPQWLHAGTNRVQFLPAESHDPGSYRVSALRIVGIPKGETRLTDAGARAWQELHDGLEGTGWRAAAGKAPDTREWIFNGPTQPWGLDVRLPSRGSGSLTIAAEGVQAPTSTKAEVTVALENLSAGWHRIPLDRLPPAEKLRITLASGKELPASISEMTIEGSPIPVDQAPRMAVTYPLSGECVNHRIHLRGFVTPAGASELDANGSPVAGALSADGAFALDLTENQVARHGVNVEAVYPGGARVRQRVAIGACIDRPPSVVVDGHPRQPVEDVGAPYGVTVKAGEAATLSFAGARLEIPAGAVDKDVRLTVRPLEKAQVARLESGMTNVSPGGQAFRFGPHGMVFKKPVQMMLPYDKDRMSTGFTANDVRTFYYDEDRHVWEQVGLVAQNDGQMVAVSEHFTDFINATVPMPEHPGTQSINPTSLKDMKLADPGAGISEIEPPKANSRGTANLRVPIEVPPGRHGLQPDLSIGYASDGGNSWLGMGWSLQTSSIQIDTRFGVPTYTGGDTYTVDGDMLTPTAVPPGAPQGTYFARRVEGRFDWIQRITLPTDSNAFYWLVTDKNGVKYTYGLNDSARLMIQSSSPNRARTSRWYLEKVQDPFGNEVLYTYTPDTGSVGTNPNNQDPFVQIYPASIQYTAHTSGSPTPAYSVTFGLGPRPANDVIVDGRAGFQVRTRQVLKTIDVNLLGSRIREYQLNYIAGDLDKTLLQSIAVKGADLTVPALYTHTFAYNTAPRQNGELAVFTNPQRMPAPASPQAWDTVKNLNESPNPSDGLGHHDGSNDSGDVGVNVLDGLVGGQVGLGSGSDDTHRMCVDMNGDGMPDPISDDGVTNFNVIDSQHLFSSFNPGSYANLSPGLGHSDNSSWNAGASALLGSAGVQYVSTSVNDSTLVTDMNGDGFPDIAFLGSGALGSAQRRHESVRAADTVVLLPGGGDLLEPDRRAGQEQPLPERPGAAVDGSVRGAGDAERDADQTRGRGRWSGRIHLLQLEHDAGLATHLPRGRVGPLRSGARQLLRGWGADCHGGAG